MKMRRMKLPTLAAVGLALIMVLAVALALAVASCGGDGSDGSEAHVEDATAQSQPTDAPLGHADEGNGETGQSVLQVTLTEWSITGDDGTSQFTAPAGDVTLEARNDGAVIHEVVIIKTDTDPADLPVTEGHVDEAAAGDEIGELEPAAGETQVGTFTLDAGTYALICNIPGHYEQGMFGQLIVEEDGTQNPPGAGEGAAGDDDGTDQSVLEVQLAEWSITGDDGTSQFTAPAGDVTLEARNDGAVIHEVVIIKTDTDPADLPVTEGHVDEAAAGDEIGELEPAAGETQVGTFTLDAGTYALICNIPGHYEQGMYAQLIVE